MVFKSQYSVYSINGKTAVKLNMAGSLVQSSSSTSEKQCQLQVEGFPQDILTPNLPITSATIEEKTVGFDCEFVERPPQAFQVDCPVCLFVLREPHQVTCCGYSFCNPCITRMQIDKNVCPTCNSVEFSVFPNKGLQRSIYEYRVLCSHQTLGCQWMGELGELGKHLNENPSLDQQFNGCEFAEMKCSDCGKSFQRQHFKAHQLEQHPFSCEYCHNYESYYEDVVKNHYPICGYRPVPCPNECGVYPERQNLEHHVSRDCPLTVVKCDFHHAGCEVQLCRKAMPAHLAENLVLHMTQQVTYSQKKVEEKEQQITQLTENLKKAIEKNCQKIDQLESNNEASLLESEKAVTLLQQKHDDAIEEVQKKEEAKKLEIVELTAKHDAVYRENEALKQKLAELEQQQKENVNMMIREARKNDEMVQKLKIKQEEECSSLKTLQSMVHTSVVPVKLTMTEFEKHKQSGDAWYSEPFYTHHHGYKMCLRVDANGHGDGKGTHLSVALFLMRGEFDDHLTWPFQGDIIVQLVNQLAKDRGHFTYSAHFSTLNDVTINNRVISSDRALNGCDKQRLLYHYELGYNPARNCKYLKEDHLHFQVTQVTNLGWSSLERQCLAIESRTCLPPFEFTMRDFELQKSTRVNWYSPSFYTNPRGYRMCLSVTANGFRSAEGTHVSAFVHLMRGEFDNYLTWPFRGDVTVQLLNQIEDKGHYEKTRDFTDDTPDVVAFKVTIGERAQGWGWKNFISHRALKYPAQNCQYLKFDNLRFRISAVKLKN